jgi:hypothetical protein
MLVKSQINLERRHDMSFNTTAFLDDAKRVHLRSYSEVSEFGSIPYTSVRSRLTEITLDGFTDDEEELVSKALDDICSNVVGNTMFRLLMAKKLPDELTITNIGPEQTLTGNSLLDQKGSSYLDYGVRVNPNVYDKNGIGIPERQYYCADESGGIALKPKSISASMFHEFTHCLHEVESRRRYRVYRAPKSLPRGNPWHTKEERRTISGYIEADAYVRSNTFDPICDNCFHMYDSIVHGKPYIPRIGHCGYQANRSQEDEDDLRDKLLRYYRAPDFSLAWPDQYMIG